MAPQPDLPPLPLPATITSHYLCYPTSTLRTHYLASGTPGQPLVILLHGFPEFSYSWRHVLPKLSAAGYFAVAPDMRGFGRTTGWDTRPFAACDLQSFSMSNCMRDTILLARGLGYEKVHCLVGHDAGARIAGLCALSRPDFYERVVLLSHPYNGPPRPPLGNHPDPNSELHTVMVKGKRDIHADLRALDSPYPRKHYKYYYSTEQAAMDLDPRVGLEWFFRAYFHLKSASWSGNNPHPLKAWEATELAKMPYYYIMPNGSSMGESLLFALEEHGGEADVEKSKSWLPDDELAVYVSEYARTGFQGGLNWYRINTDPKNLTDLDPWAGMKMLQPCLMILGKADWGSYQEPGVLENMGNFCAKLRGIEMVDNAGHWMQQEQPDVVAKSIIRLCSEAGGL